LLLVLAAVPGRTAERDLKLYFAARCAVCHGLDGTGRGPGGVHLGARGFREGTVLGKASDAALAQTIRQGAGAMPAFGAQITEAEARRMVAEVIRPLAARRHR
jgi:mono/diheme cytochrome c family protein